MGYTEYVTDGTCQPSSLPSKAIMSVPWCVVCMLVLRLDLVVMWRQRRAYALNTIGPPRRG